MNVTSATYQPLSVTAFGTQAEESRGFTPAASLERTHEAAEGLASDLTLRLTSYSQDEDKDSSSLASSLIDSIDYIAQEFGSDAASAAMGIVTAGIGEGEINEDALGNGLLNVIRFMDRNFGIEGGDKVMAQFNGELNDAMNDYFDNGLTEKFYAVTSETSTISQAVSSIVTDLQEAYGEDLAQTVSDLIQDNLEDGLTMSNLRQGIAQAKNELAANAAPGSAAFLAQAAQDVFAQLDPSQGAAPKGTQLDIAI